MSEEEIYTTLGRRITLREGGVEKSLNAISREMYELRMERLRFEQSFLRRFHRVGAYVSVVMGACFLILLTLDKFMFIQYALGSVIILSTFLDAHVDRLVKKFSEREAALDERLRLLNSIVFVHGSDGPL